MTSLARARTLPALLMCCALLLGAAAALLASASGAHADTSIGKLTLDQDGGSTDDNPFAVRVTTDAPCPADQADRVRLMVINPATGESLSSASPR